MIDEAAIRLRWDAVRSRLDERGWRVMRCGCESLTVRRGVSGVLFCIGPGQLVKDQPDLIVIEPDGLNGWGGLLRLCQNQRVKDFSLPVWRDRPIAVEGSHRAGVAKILTVGFPLFRCPADFLTHHGQGVSEAVRIVIWQCLCRRDGSRRYSRSPAHAARPRDLPRSPLAVAKAVLHAACEGGRASEFGASCSSLFISLR
jgi:hypothetical protein